MPSKKLHVFLALRESVKNLRKQKLTAAHRLASHEELFEGQTRTYQPKNEDGDKLPTENKNVQLNADTALNALVDAVTRDWDIMATINAGDQLARADVVVPTTVEGVNVTILSDVPATFLLYLARELDDVRTYIRNLPTLDPAVKWTYDEGVAAYVAEPVTTHRTKKVMQNHVKWEPTPGNDKHPAQVETFNTDVVDGYWTLIRRSGALSAERKHVLLQRVEELIRAVREARENANDTEVYDVNVARPIFDFLLGGEA